MTASGAGAQTTALYFDSQPGDYIGQGQQRTWTTTDLTFSVSPNSDPSRVQIRANSSSFATWWDLNFGAPGGEPLTAGTYEKAGRFYFVAGSSPALDVSGSGRGCNWVMGRFVVYEVAFGAGGAVTRFAADFEQHCDDATPALFGAIRYDSSRSSLVPFDGAYPVYSIHIEPAVNGYVTGTGIDCGAGRMDCDEVLAAPSAIPLEAVASPGYVFVGWEGLDCAGDVSLTVTVGRRKSCTAVFTAEPGSGGVESPDYSQGFFLLDGPIGSGEPASGGPRQRHAFTAPASEFSASGSPSQLEFTVAGPRAVEWRVRFAAPEGSVLAPGLYEYTSTNYGPSGPLPSLHITNDGGCTSGGRFRIYELAVAPGGTIARFAADFEQRCTNGIVTGAIRYRSTRASLLPFDGRFPAYEIRIVPSTGGYVTASGIDCGEGRTDCVESFGSPTAVTLEATPLPGYDFFAWSGSCAGGVPIVNVTVDRVERCFAIFNPSMGGTAAPDPALAVGTLFVDMPGATTGPTRRIWLATDSSVRLGYGFGNTVSFTFRTVMTDDSMSVTFGVPGGRLTPGVYNEAYPLSGSAIRYPLLSAGCFQRAARFRIYEATYDGSGRIVTFAADFEVHCNSTMRPYMAGAVRYSATRAALRPFDGAYPVYSLTIQPAAHGTVRATGLDCGGDGHADCTETYPSATVVMLQAMPAAGYRFVGWTGGCDGLGTTTVAVTWVKTCSAVFSAVRPGSLPDDPRLASASLLIDSGPGELLGGGLRRVWLDPFISTQIGFGRNSLLVRIEVETGTWSIDFRAPGTAELRPGVYENATGNAFGSSTASPGLRIFSPANSCSTVAVGRFVIYEITYGQGTSLALSSFAADFEYRCRPDAPALFGSIRYNSMRSELRPFPPARGSAQGDLDGDGRPDLLLQNRATGQLTAWFMRGTLQVGAGPLSPGRVADQDWHIVGSGDVDRDGQIDLFWQHQTTGALAIWYMYETVLLRGEALVPGAVADTRWKVRAVTDLDRDGYPDLIWQHTGNGMVSVWFMTGSRLRSGELLVPGQVSDLNWKIVGAGDVTGDGSPDLFWHHAVSGQIAVWLMNGRVLLSGHAITPDRVSDVTWQVRGVGDIDGNGSSDLIWQNTATLQIAAWLMSGLRLIDGRLLTAPALPNADWQVVSPR